MKFSCSKLLFTLDFIQQSWDMTLHTWMLCLNVFITCLWTVIVSIWHKKTMCAGFAIFQFFLNLLCSFEFWSNTNFDQHLNKLGTWKWKYKPGSILVTPKWSYGEVFETFHVPTLNHFSFTLDFIVQCSMLSHSMHGFFFRMYVDLVYQLQSLVYHIIRLCA